MSKEKTGKKQNTFYVTTAIDYVNAKPHIGHSYQKVLADALARWYKQQGADVFFLTGTDEHGQKLADSAKEAGLPPKKFVDKMAKYFKKAWDNLNIKYDRFIRTTDKDHEAAVKDFIKLLHKNGDIYEGKYEGLYCKNCERYYTEKDLEDDKCPEHGTKPRLISEPCYFFRLSKYQGALLDLYEQRKQFVLPKTRFNEVKQRVRSGLKDLAISRTTLDWGIPFPLGSDHVTYVWFEALLNYITGIGWNKNIKKFNKYWPADVHLLGKDNNWFHAVIWPAILLAAGIEPPKTVYAHGFVNLKGQKMSKSLGNVIDPNYICKKYSVDAYRYYFTRALTPREDNYFIEKDLVAKYNAELADDLGNLVSRTLAMIEKSCDGKIPKAKVDKKLQKKAKSVLKTASKHIEICDADRAVETIWELVKATNKYIQDKKPWKLKGKKKEKVLFNAANAIKNICALAWPVIPGSLEKIVEQLGLKTRPLHSDIGSPIKAGTKVKRGKPVFPKLEYKPDEKVFNLDVRAGKIVKVEDVPKSSKLLKLIVEFGKSKKQAVAGLKPYFKKSELQGKKFVFLVNLKPAKLAGEKSECMILAAEKGGKFDLLKPTGKKIKLEGFKSEPAEQVKLDTFAAWKFKVRDGKALSGDAVLHGVKSKFEKGKVV